MKKQPKNSARTNLIMAIAKVLGFLGSKATESDIFLGEKLGLAPKTIKLIRWQRSFTAEPSKKLKELLGDSAKHFTDLDTICNFGTETSGKAATVSKSKPKKRKKRGPYKSRSPKATKASVPATNPVQPAKEASAPAVAFSPIHVVLKYDREGNTVLEVVLPPGCEVQIHSRVNGLDIGVFSS